MLGDQAFHIDALNVGRATGHRERHLRGVDKRVPELFPHQLIVPVADDLRRCVRQMVENVLSSPRFYQTVAAVQFCPGFL